MPTENVVDRAHAGLCRELRSVEASLKICHTLIFRVGAKTAELDRLSAAMDAVAKLRVNANSNAGLAAVARVRRAGVDAGASNRYFKARQQEGVEKLLVSSGHAIRALFAEMEKYHAGR